MCVPYFGVSGGWLGGLARYMALDEVIEFIKREEPYRLVRGLVDQALLASALTTPGARLRIMDRRLSNWYADSAWAISSAHTDRSPFEAPLGFSDVRNDGVFIIVPYGGPR